MVGYTTKCQLAQVTFSSKARCAHGMLFRQREIVANLRGGQGRSVPDNFLRRLREVVNVPHHCLATVSVALHTSQLRIVSSLRIEGLQLLAVTSSSRGTCLTSAVKSAPEVTLNPSCQKLRGSLDEGFDRFPHPRDRHSHLRGQCCSRFLELHDSTSIVMLALPNERRNGGFSFHISAVSQFRLPNSLAKRFPCATETRPPTPWSVSATRNLILATGSTGYTRPLNIRQRVFSLVIPHQVIVRTRNSCARCAQRQRRSNARCHHASRLQNDVLDGHRLETLHACLHGASWVPHKRTQLYTLSNLDSFA